jgi:hypothetical protein
LGEAEEDRGSGPRWRGNSHVRKFTGDGVCGAGGLGEGCADSSWTGSVSFLENPLWLKDVIDLAIDFKKKLDSH